MANPECTIGCVIAQRLTGALTGLGIPYEKLSDVIYKELREISLDLIVGDWLEFPNGDTYTKTFTVKTFMEDKNE